MIGAISSAARRRVNHRWRALAGLAGLAWLVCFASSARAHPTGFALLTIDQRAEGEVDAVLRVSGAADRARLVEVVFPAGCSERAPTTTRVVSTGIDRTFRLRCDALRGELELRGLPVDLQARVEVREDAGGAMRTVETAVLDAGRPRVRLGGASSEGAFGRYLVLGVEHIAFGIDHVLFVVALVLLVRTPRRAILTATAFTLGHSVTLALASLELVDVATAPVEACIALSVLLVARELRSERPSAIHAHPELAAALFGLLHGLGFASALSEIGLPSDALVTSLFAFNLGVELGQIALVAIGLSLLALASRRLDERRRARFVETPIAYALGAVAAYWSIERVIAVLFA
jgi:hydrogenase/urease accessory protein HupE